MRQLLRYLAMKSFDHVVLKKESATIGRLNHTLEKALISIRSSTGKGCLYARGYMRTVSTAIITAPPSHQVQRALVTPARDEHVMVEGVSSVV